MSDALDSLKTYDLKTVRLEFYSPFIYSLFRPTQLPYIVYNNYHVGKIHTWCGYNKDKFHSDN